MKSTLKLLTAIIKDKLDTAEKQQGFRKNRSTVDVTFIVRQIVEKSVEYNKPSYKGFVDLRKQNKNYISKRGYIPVNGGIRHGNSPLLFNVIMDKIIDEMKKREGYRMGTQYSKLCG